MSIHSTAKSKVFIGSANATISTILEFEDEDWTEIKEIEDLGEWGPEAKELSFESLDDNYTRRRKGVIDSGSVPLVVARDPQDPGQAAARAAVNSSLPYAFKVEIADKSTALGTNTVAYFRAVVLSARNSFGTANDITKTTFNLGIDGKVLEVPGT